jgi:hypothetical protein
MSADWSVGCQNEKTEFSSNNHIKRYPYITLLTELRDSGESRVL